MTSMSISDCRCLDGYPSNIFQTKDPKEIKMHYDQLLATRSGKWSAKIYLEIMKTLNGKIEEDLPSDDRMVSEPCLNTKFTTIRPTMEANVLKMFSKKDPPVERSYQKIFKNARENRKSPEKMKSIQEKSRDSSSLRSDQTPSPMTNSAKTSQYTSSEEVATPGALHQRGCRFVGSGINNYLVELRERNKAMEPSMDRFSRSLSSIDRQASVCSAQDADEVRGDVGLFAHQTVDGLLQNSLDDQAGKIKENIGKPGARLSIPNDEQSLMNLLKQALHMKDEEVFEFEEKFPRWRRKFVVDKIEQSDQAETVDQSDLETGGTSFCSDNNPPDEEEKLRKIVSKPSRIPYVEEVRRLNRQLFDKLAVKWDRILVQCANHEDLSLTPNWSRIIGDIQLRSHEPFVGKILKSMKLNSRFRKVFVPSKYRSYARERVSRRNADNIEKVDAKRKMLENFSITSKPVQKAKRNLLECCRNRRPEKDGKDLLNDLVEETDRKAKAGNFSWEKKEIAEHYLKLCAIIKTKQRPVELETINDEAQSQFL